MTRRDCLTRLFGAAVAAAVAPLINLADATPAFWNQAPLRKLMPWRISFSDGTTFSFDAVVVAEKMLYNGNVQLTLRQTGLPQITTEVSRSEETTVETNPYPRMSLEEIMLPSLERTNVNYEDVHVAGIVRRSDLVITVRPA